MTIASVVAFHVSDDGSVTKRKVLEARCRKCGYTFRVADRESAKLARAGLCACCYYSEDGPGYREGLCQYPECEEVVTNLHRKAKYCEAHFNLMLSETLKGKGVPRKSVGETVDQAVSRIAQMWNRSDISGRVEMLLASQLTKRDVSIRKSIALPWEKLPSPLRRRLAFYLGNSIIA